MGEASAMLQSLDRSDSDVRHERPIWRTDDYVRFWNHEDRRVRAWALRRLRLFDPATAARLAPAGLEDRAREVQREALAAIASLDQPPSEALRRYLDRNDILAGLRTRAAAMLVPREAAERESDRGPPTTEWSDDALRQRGPDALRSDEDQAWTVLGTLERKPWRWAAALLLDHIDDVMRGSLATEVWEVVEEIGDPDALGRVLEEWRPGEPRIAATALFLAMLGDRIAEVPAAVQTEAVAWRAGLDDLERVLRRPEDADQFIRDAPLTLLLECTACGRRYGYEVRYVLVHPEVFPRHLRPGGDPTEWDGVVLSRIIECKHCGAEDQYELTARAVLVIAAKMGVVPRSDDPDPEDGHGVMMIAACLWDGTIMQRPSEGIRHLRALAEKSPERGEPWRRLGNLYKRYDRMREAEEAWRRAVRDETEMEAAYSLAVWLGKDERPREGVPFLLMAIERLPAAKLPDDQRRAMAEVLCDILREAAPRLRPPLALQACWNDGHIGGQPIVRLSCLELTRIRWERLAELLGSARFLSLGFTTELPDDDETQLEALLEGDFDPPVPHVRAAPRVGRNEPCPCGSGKKHKKCCLRS